jgi:hypothetical protein
MPRSRREFLTRARLLAARALLSAPALADPSPEVRWTMRSTSQPSLDRLRPNRRGLVVAVAGIVFGVMSQASLVEGSLRSEFSANHAAVATAHRDFRPGSRANWERVAPERIPTPHTRKPRVEIARN